jgi:hypothetical protein
MTSVVNFKILGEANFSPIYAEIAKLRAAIASVERQSVGSLIGKEAMLSLKESEARFLRNISAIQGMKAETVALSTAVERNTKSLAQGKMATSQYLQAWKPNKGIIRELDQIAAAQARIRQSMILPSSKTGMAHVITDTEGLANSTLKAKIYTQALNTTMRDATTQLLNFGKNTQWAGRQLTAGRNNAYGRIWCCRC